MFKAIAAVALTALICTAATAGAASLITSAQIKNGTIQTRDLSSSAKRTLKGNAGTRGATGQRGPAGPAGPSAVGQLARYESTTTVAPFDAGYAIAACPAGQRAVSGGYVSISADGEAFFSYDAGTRAGWAVGLDNLDSSVEGDLTAYVYCAPAGVAVAAGDARSRLRARARGNVERLRALQG